MAHHGWKSDCKVYVGGLRDDANRYDLEDAFAKIGKVSIDSIPSWR
jgi:RNA recognition motif-containing protein